MSDEHRIVLYFKPTDTGGFPPYERGEVAHALRHLRGKMVRVVVEEVLRPASTPQKRYYNGVALPRIHKHFKAHGVHTIREETHEYLKRHVGGLIDYDAQPDAGGKYPTRSFSAEATNPVNVREMSQFMERLWAWAAQINLPLPPPSEPWDY